MLSQKVQEPRPLKFPEPWFLSEQPKFVPRQPSSGPFFFQGGQWCQCVTSTSSTSSISKIWWSRASSTKSTWRTKRVSGNFCDLAMKFRLKLNHLFCFKMLLGWSFIVQWDSESVYIYTYIYIPFENLGDAWVAEGGALDESILIVFAANWCKLRIKHIYVLKLIYFQVLICFSMFDYFEIPLSCFGKLVFFLHVRENIREVGRIFGSFSSAKRWFPCWACILPGMTWAVFAAGAFQYTCSSKISDGGVKIADGQGLCWEMQVHDGPRFMANDNIIFAYDMSFWFVLCGLNLRSLPIILILRIPSWQPGSHF